MLRLIPRRRAVATAQSAGDGDAGQYCGEGGETILSGVHVATTVEGRGPSRSRLSGGGDCDGRERDLGFPFAPIALSTEADGPQLAEGDGETVVRLRTVSSAVAPSAARAIAAPAPTAALAQSNPSSALAGEPAMSVGSTPEGTGIP